jgi:hypothetical protein
MAWTTIPKPTSSGFTAINPVGREQYDQSDVTYDSSTVFYDGTNVSQWTSISKPTSSVWTAIPKPV